MAGFSRTTTTTICALLIFFAVCYLPRPAGSVFFNYSTFSPADQKDIKIEGNASLSAGRIDVTPSMENCAGRASYAHPVPIWDSTTGKVASFTTGFSFAIPLTDEGINNKGTGMAFFLASYPSSLPARSYGFNLGLTNQSPNAVASGDNRFVAVEFDTFNDTIVHDPHTTYDHLGIDVNSLISVNTLAPPSFSLRGNMTAMIEYDSVSSILSVSLRLIDLQGMPFYDLKNKVDLKSALPEQVAVGFSAATSTSVELHQVRSWYFNSSFGPNGTPPPRSSSAGVIGGATAGAALFILLCITAALLIHRRNNMKKIEEEEEIGTEDEDGEPIMEVEMETGPRRFPYHELLDATRNFAVEEKLGQGGFGAVYRGYLRELGLAVAIKRFSKESSMQGRKEYKSEIKVITRLRHRNLVQLIGWCHGRDELLLVYELMRNRSLDIHLHSKDTFLTWPMRVKIVLGLGSALLYLHEEWEQCVVHRDIKPSNVMLDESFGAKLGDFGLARFIDHAVGTQTMTAASGTPGYVDPQCLITGRVSAESDVYSFGIVLLEVACGRRPVSLLDNQMNGVFRLVEWVWELYGRGAVLQAADERLGGDYDEAEMERVMAVGLWCAHPDPSVRPSIRAAMAVLQSKEANLPVLPAKMPVPTYAPPVAVPDGLYLYGTSPTGMSSSSGGAQSSIRAAMAVRMPVPTYAPPVAMPDGLFLYGTSPTGMSSSSGGAQSMTASGFTQPTSSSSDASTLPGPKDSSSLLKHRY